MSGYKSLTRGERREAIARDFAPDATPRLRLRWGRIVGLFSALVVTTQIFWIMSMILDQLPTRLP